MAVVIGLMASSSLALAEGKFAYRQPLQGIDVSPTFGMTKTEKQEYLNNIDMCSKQHDSYSSLFCFQT